MRVTDSMYNQNFIMNLRTNSARLYERETEVMTNKRLNKPSDDPVDAMTALEIRDKLSRIEQYDRNIGRAMDSLEKTQQVVMEVGDIMSRFQAITIKGASDAMGPDGREPIRFEMNELIEMMYNVANNRDESKYMFAGSTSDTPPYKEIRNADGDIEEVLTVGSTGDIKTTISENVELKINITGEELFEENKHIFKIMISARDHMEANDMVSLRDDIEEIREATKKTDRIESMVGARINRAESARNRGESNEVQFKEYLSNIEDMDPAEAIKQYQIQLFTLQSTLQAGAELQRYHLTDFLR